MLERDIEKAVCTYAKDRGFLVHKMQTGRGGTAGWPDRMFIRDGRVFFCEFKRTGGKLSELQKRMIHILQQHHISVYVIDNITEGKNMIDGEVAVIA